MSTIGGVEIRNTANLIGPNTKICTLIQGPPKRGKTSMAATLDTMCKKFFGKPALFIATEGAEGGGTMSIQELGVDYIQPENLEQWNSVVAGLGSDTKYAGVVVDSSSDLIQRYIKPMALKMPARTNPPSRSKGVPVWDDYNVMGEFGRIEFNKLINLTTHPNPDIRKHLVVTAIEKEFSDDDGNLKAIKTNLPGQLRDGVTAMFQTVGRILIRMDVVPSSVNPAQKVRVPRYTFVTKNDSIADIGDRTHVLPPEAPCDFVEIWDKYFIPRIQGVKP
jgi:hypothetical protein